MKQRGKKTVISIEELQWEEKEYQYRWPNWKRSFNTVPAKKNFWFTFWA